jgi:hypothetical protein
MTEVLSAIVTGAVGGTIGSFVGGAVLWYFQHRTQVRREAVERAVQQRMLEAAAEEQRRITPKNLTRLLTNETVRALFPGSSLDQARELLGTPNKVANSETDVFTEESVETNSYLYLLGNAWVKITSVDNRTIDSFTIIAHMASLNLPDVPFTYNDHLHLGESRVTAKLLEISNATTVIATRIDNSFAISQYVPNPFYRNFTYFGYGLEIGEMYRYHETQDTNLFLNGTVDGVCISNDENSRFFIYDYETR